MVDQKSRHKDKYKAYLQALREIDWQDVKASVYATIHYGGVMMSDECRKRLFETHEERLGAYKYKPHVDAANEEIKHSLHAIGRCDEQL